MNDWTINVNLMQRQLLHVYNINSQIKDIDILDTILCLHGW